MTDRSELLRFSCIGDVAGVDQDVPRGNAWDPFVHTMGIGYAHEAHHTLGRGLRQTR